MVKVTISSDRPPPSSAFAKIKNLNVKIYIKNKISSDRPPPPLHLNISKSKYQKSKIQNKNKKIPTSKCQSLFRNINVKIKNINVNIKNNKSKCQNQTSKCRNLHKKTKYQVTGRPPPLHLNISKSKYQKSKS